MLWLSPNRRMFNGFTEVTLGVYEKLGLDEIEVYNEFSLQHELGIFLRNKLSDKYKILFEKNVKDFHIDKEKVTKREIDIVVQSRRSLDKYAVELKFPRNGEYPEQMFSFIKDIRFMEELKERGFQDTFCLTVVDDHRFYSDAGRLLADEDKIYKYFRKKNTLLSGSIQKPTGKKDKTVTLSGEYHISWKDCIGKEGWKYYLIKI